MDKYEKDLAIFGVVWIVVVGILLYSFFKSPKDSNPSMGT